MTFTDFIVAVLTIYLLIRGYCRGFMNSLMGPVSIIAASVISVIYYQQTKQVPMSLAIGLIGPMVLFFIFKLIWKSLSDTKRPTFPSSVAGAFLTLMWGWLFIAMTLLTLSIIPPLVKPLEAIKEDVAGSACFTVLRPIQKKLMPASQKKASPSATASQADIQTLSKDPRFQKVFQDPEVQKEINAHDLGKLMSNPKIMELTQELMNDPAALKKVMAVYQAQQNQSSK